MTAPHAQLALLALLVRLTIFCAHLERSQPIAHKAHAPAALRGHSFQRLVRLAARSAQQARTAVLVRALRCCATLEATAAQLVPQHRATAQRVRRGQHVRLAARHRVRVSLGLSQLAPVRTYVPHAPLARIKGRAVQRHVSIALLEACVCNAPRPIRRAALVLSLQHLARALVLRALRGRTYRPTVPPRVTCAQADPFVRLVQARLQTVQQAATEVRQG